MATFDEIKQRVKELKARSGRSSITVIETFGVIDELLEKTRYVDMNQGSLTIKAIYPSVAAMQADQDPRDQAGRLLNYGQLVCIANESSSYADNGSIYSFQAPGWKYIDRVGDYQTFVKKNSVTGQLGNSPDLIPSQLCVNIAVEDLKRKLQDVQDILPFGGIQYMHDLGSTDRVTEYDGNGVVYYDDAEYTWFKYNAGICYLNWAGRYPKSLYTQVENTCRRDKIYLDVENKGIYSGDTDGSLIKINKLMQVPGQSENDVMSQKAVTAAINLLTTRVINATEVLPFDGFVDKQITINGNAGTAYDEILFSNKLYHFVAMRAGDTETYYNQWDNSELYNEKVGENWFAKGYKIFSCVNLTYMVDYDNTSLLLPTSNIVHIYQTTGTSTSGTMSQDAITRIKIQHDRAIESLTENISVNSDSISLLLKTKTTDLGVLEDEIPLNSLDNGVFSYKTKGRVIQGKPTREYTHLLISVDDSLFRFDTVGFMTRLKNNATWVDYRINTQVPISGEGVLGESRFSAEHGKPLWSDGFGRWMDANGNTIIS